MVHPKHLKFHSILLFLLLLLPHYGVKAESPIQPAPPLASPTRWDVSSIGVIVGAFIATFISVAVFSLFLRRCFQSFYNAKSSSQGIDPELLKTFPILFYSSIKHFKEGPLQCAVCLNDFNDHDTLRLLPQCNHVFHPACIDAWLYSHVTCPVCRAVLDHRCSPKHVAISIDTVTNGQCSSSCGGCEGEGRKNSEGKGKGWPERASKSKLLRSNSTGHSPVKDGACVEKYTLRLPVDVMNSILMKHGVMQRSASYNFVGSSMKGLCWSDSEESIRGKIKKGSVTGKNLK